MKSIIIYAITILVTLIGWTCTAFYFMLPGMEWYHIPLGFGSLLILSPAFSYLHNFFKEVLK